MKIGFCMLLWTTFVTDRHRAILEDIKSTGYDGVEVPIFEGTPDDYARLGKMLDGIGLECTAITVIPSPDKNPLSDDASVRRAAVDYLKYCIDCSEALGSKQLAGPLHQTLGLFSGMGPTEVERARARDFHREVGDYAAAHGNQIVLEAINRFECYFANTMDDLAAYLDNLGHPAVTGMYDTFHANIEEQDPIAAIGRNIRHISYVHVSENDRGVPGRGHVPWAATFGALKQAGFDGWLTIEAFGRGLPELAAATRVWRDFAESPEAVYREGVRTIREGWATA
ncbi:MAG TPA: sugar phosphate isomerase/epimerase family protein [Propylenella sp.]|nr:sugar phosphate isomerase/epimerase family protein [Propylenella sp.]